MEQHLRWICGSFGVVSVDTTILQTFLFPPACIACTDMVYSKELECDVTTTAMAKAILHLFLPFDIKLNKSHSGFDMIKVLLSKQSFFQHLVWPV